MAIAWAMLALLLYFYLAYFIERSSFHLLIGVVAILFGSYFYSLRQLNDQNINQFFLIGLGFRLAFLVSFPALSDDFYRFIWDGELLNKGFNPYHWLPSEFPNELENKEALLKGMNSPNYFSVYPPVLQYLFSISVRFFSQSMLSAIVSMRVLIILAEVGNFFLIKRILKQVELPQKSVLIYFLNPLIIIELTGNLHFEACMIFFFLVAVYALLKPTTTRIVWSALACAMAFLTKLIPLILVPIIWKKLGVRKSVWFTLLLLFSILLLSIPIIDGQGLQNISRSLDLYFETFEFNASIYYVLRYIGFEWRGYNMIHTIGPILTFVSSLGMFYFLFLRKQSDWEGSFKGLLFALSLYYMLAMIVHPWYISFLVLIGCFTNYAYPILWSFLAFLSYSAYQWLPIAESPYLLSLEYLLLLSFLWYEAQKGGMLSQVLGSSLKVNASNK